MELNTDIFKLFNKQWSLLTAGKKDDFNSMTISWGGLGTLWNKPVATVYVRTSRYTHKFMEDNDYFTLSFFPESCREALSVLGSKSGRDIDKMHYPGLSVKEDERGIIYNEAELTLVCKKLYMQRMDEASIPEEDHKRFYENDAIHDIYIGEVVDIIR